MKKGKKTIVVFFIQNSAKSLEYNLYSVSRKCQELFSYDPQSRVPVLFIYNQPSACQDIQLSNCSDMISYLTLTMTHFSNQEIMFKMDKVSHSGAHDLRDSHPSRFSSGAHYSIGRAGQRKAPQLSQGSARSYPLTLHMASRTGLYKIKVQKQLPSKPTTLLLVVLYQFRIIFQTKHSFRSNAVLWFYYFLTLN